MLAGSAFRFGHLWCGSVQLISGHAIQVGSVLGKWVFLLGILYVCILR